MQPHQVSKTHYKVSDFITWAKAGTLILSPSFQRPHGSLFGVQFGNNNAGNLASAGLDRDGEGAANVPNAAVKRELSNEQGSRESLS